MPHEGLEAEQLDAVRHGQGPLLVVAGAGTGKTTTLAHRVAHLIDSGIAPSRILLLTFTRRAAADMLRRVSTLLAGRTATAEAVWGGTFHSVAVRLLRSHGPSIGLDRSFTVLDRADAEDLIGMVRAELELGSVKRRFPGKSTCLDIYSRCVNAQQPLRAVVQERFRWCAGHTEDLGRLFEAFVDRKESRRLLDYDDLLVFWHALLSDETVGKSVRDRFDAVLVDEYQDTNPLQADIVALLSPSGRGLTAVGDDAQAIYSFRAATVRNILDFPDRFPGTRVLTLVRNHRSTAPILEAGNRLIALSAERYEKELVTDRKGGEKPRLVSCLDEEEQASFVAAEALSLREEGIPLRKQAVLFRASHHSLALEMELAARDIPFRKYGGLRFAETAHVKDALSFLRLAENPFDEVAAMRVLCLLPGVGPASARRLSQALIEAGGRFDVWMGHRPSTGIATLWDELLSLMRGLSATDPPPLGSQINAIRTTMGALILRGRSEPAARERDLEQLEISSARYPDRSRFLSELTLDPPAWTEDLASSPCQDDDWLVLSTMHSAKGLEFDVVFILHAADGNIPADMATGSWEEIEEERRLLYVACTRARDSLYVCHPLRYHLAGRASTDVHGYSQLTRFIPSHVAECFEPLLADRLDAEEAPARLAAGGTADIRRSIKRMW